MQNETTPTSIHTPAAFPSVFINTAHPPRHRPCPAISNNKHCRAHLDERKTLNRCLRAAAWESPQRCRSESIACDWYVNSKWQLCTGNWMESTSGPGSKNVNRSCSYLFVQHPSNGILPRSDVFTPFSARSSCLRCHRSEAIESDFVFTFPGTGHAEEWK